MPRATHGIDRLLLKVLTQKICFSPLMIRGYIVIKSCICPLRAFQRTKQSAAFLL